MCMLYVLSDEAKSDIPRDLVAELLARNSRNLIADALVCVEVQSQTCVVPMVVVTTPSSFSTHVKPS